jgi:hypothetical protein
LRVRQIDIRAWRNFRNIRLEIDDGTGLVCLVGANGTGKSHLLELVAANAHHFGLSDGTAQPRGDPFAEDHDFTVTFDIDHGAVASLEEAGLENFDAWDRTLGIESRRSGTEQFMQHHWAGGLDEKPSRVLASAIARKLRESPRVHFLSLDADRAYPKQGTSIHDAAQAYETDWSNSEYTRGRSFRPTSALYAEWLKYALARENQEGTRLMQEIRKSREQDTAAPEFQDPFSDYSKSLQLVLPHLAFSGVDLKRRLLLFDLGGMQLTFDQLSGGEREIAFLLGQIDRFRLREGLFLIDEPELHLNADMVRTWVSYLAQSVETGQVWLATHSLEAVEAAGQHGTFVLERSAGSKVVDMATRLDARPVIAALSRAMGSPAFSISKLRFVFIEGEDGLGERDRFHRVCGGIQDVRFMESGSGDQVAQRLSSTRALAKEFGEEIRAGGIVDRDFRSEVEAKALTDAREVFVLPVHEVENLFLQPDTIDALLSQNGQAGKNALEIIRAAADDRAGSWAFQRAFDTTVADGLPPIPPAAKSVAKGATWAAIDADRAAFLSRVSKASGFRGGDVGKVEKVLDVAIKLYEKRRAEPGLWKVCEGKEVLPGVTRACGLASPSGYVLAVVALWNRGGVALPMEVQAVREFVSNL